MSNVYIGIEFKKKYGTVFYKILREDLTHHDFTFKEGINIDTNKFNPFGSCSKGGIYFTNYENIYDYLDYGINVCSVNILDDSLVYVEDKKFKADKIDIQNICLISDSVLFSNKTELEYMNIVNKNGLLLKYIKNQTKKICKAAVIQNENALQFVFTEHITEETCKIVVTQNGNALKFMPIEKKSEKICKIAVKQDGNALEFVPKEHKSEEICKIAVTQNGYALKYVPEELKSEEICKIAVMRTGYALTFVPNKHKSEEICKIAVTLDWICFKICTRKT